MKTERILIAVGTAAFVAAVALLSPWGAPQPSHGSAAIPAAVESPVTVPASTPEFYAGRVEEAVLITREELEARLRELAAFAAAGNGQAYGDLFTRLVETYERRLLPPLAEILLDASHDEIGAPAAHLISAVAAAEDAPLVASVIAGPIADEPTEILLGVMIRQAVDAAVDPARAIVPAAARGESVRRAAIAYLGVAATLSAVEGLTQALESPDTAPLHPPVAEALAGTAKPEAARTLLRVWTDRFEPTAERASRIHFLLRALGSMPVEVAGAIVREFVEAERDPSRKNLVLSIAPMFGAEFALALARDVLARSDEHYRVREQAIEVVGSLHTVESQRFLIQILTATELQTDLFAAANQLTIESALLVEFAEVRAAYAAEESEIPQAVLVILMARDGASVRADAELFDELWTRVRGWMASPNPALVMYASTAYALLSALADRPAEMLAELLNALDVEQASLTPAIVQQIDVLEPDEARPLWDRILAEPGYASYMRAYAVRGLLRAGDFDDAWAAIRGEPDGGMQVTLAGIAMAEQGPEGLPEYRRMAAEEEDPETQQAMNHQVQVWEDVYQGQQQVEDAQGGK